MSTSIFDSVCSRYKAAGLEVTRLHCILYLFLLVKRRVEEAGEEKRRGGGGGGGEEGG